MERVVSKIRNLDAYPKINEDFFTRTISGGLITLLSSLFILVLFVSELSSYLSTSIDTKLVVDTSRGGRLHINFDVTFPDVSCSLLSLDAMDISGERHFDIRHDIFKRRIDSHGKGIEIKQGGIGASKISHTINKLAFGDHFRGAKNPLDRVQWAQGAQNGIYQYFLKVVPTVYTNIRGREIQSNQFSVTEHFKSTEFGVVNLPPGIYFYYDISPIKVTLTEDYVSFLHFITYLCAIIGGIFSVAGIIDSFVYHGQKVLKKKA